ncbi:hypothetical protein CRYUN_Cryun37aG0022400 [Craigia yunnanensis]
MSLSCLSDGGASSSSAGSSSSGRTGGGRQGGGVGVGVGLRRKQSGSKGESGSGGVRRRWLLGEQEKVARNEILCRKEIACSLLPQFGVRSLLICTYLEDPCYAAFHDEECGVLVHDDKKLFQLLSLSGALAELTWPTILGKRHMFREIFLEFDPSAVSKLNEKKIGAPGSPASSLLSELKI